MKLLLAWVNAAMEASTVAGSRFLGVYGTGVYVCATATSR